MKTLLFFILSGLLFGCSSQDNSTKNIENKEVPTAKDTSQAGCNVCLIERKLNRLLRDKSILANSDDSICAAEHILPIEKEIDSLNNQIFKLKKKFKLTDDQQDVSYRAEATCSKLFPINHVRDTLKRDSLLYSLYWWDNEKHPIFDTTCRENKIVDGKYAIKLKGKLFLLTKSEYDRWIVTNLDIMSKMDYIISKRKSILVSELTGIENPNESCIEIMIRYANYRESKLWPNYPKVIAGYADPEFKKLYDSLGKIN